MRDVRPVGMPALPWLSNFQEMNVRTYVLDDHGVPGIWFYSLDCNQPVAALAARLCLGLPYYYAQMSASRNGAIDFTSRRRGTSETARYRYRATGENTETVPGTLEFFLLERYFLFSKRTSGNSLIRNQVKHVSYRFREVDLGEVSTLPAELDHLPQLQPQPDHVCVVDGFDVKVFGTEKV